MNDSGLNPSIFDKLFGFGAGRRTTSPDSIWQKIGMPLALLALAVFFSLNESIFLSETNLFNIGRQASVTAIAAIGAAMIFINGGMDISQGAVMAFAGITTISILNGTGLPDVVCIALALCVGLAFGSANGFLAEIIRIPPFIATLGTALVIRGAAYVWTQGVEIGVNPGRGALFSWLGQGYVGPIPSPLIEAVVLYIGAALVLRNTVWGRHTYAIGSNEDAARVAGIHVTRHRIQTYALGGLFAAAAGVIVSAQLSSAAPSTATGAEFDIITVVVLGGVSIYGGRGKILRVFVAAIFLAALDDGMILINIPTYYQEMIQGIVFLIALSLDQLGSRKR